MAETCPTCGSPVRVASFDEGTGHYAPLYPEVQAQATAFRAMLHLIASGDHETEPRMLAQAVLDALPET